MTFEDDDGRVYQVGGRAPSGETIAAIEERDGMTVVTLDTGATMRFGDAGRRASCGHRVRLAAREAASLRHAARMYAWCRAARRRTAMTGPIAFHVSPPDARAAIAAEGLDTTKRKHFVWIDRPEAVFLYGTLTDALYFAWGERGDVWAVSASGLPLAQDPNESSAWMTPRAIEPERLLWLGRPPAGEPWHWPMMRAARRAWPGSALLGDAFGADSHTPDPAVP